ncbi:MAG: hypothetical protein R3195_01440 [Gemmatimonadota bacterium]|nr:hypothetical protein [Gemmatimonadota bacterium]
MSDHDRGWFDEPRNVTLLVRILTVVCVALVVADLFYHKHVHFAWEEWFGIYGFFGFAAFFFIVMAGRELRKVLMRDEDYYDD